jgi:hypothetical protein
MAIQKTCIFLLILSWEKKGEPWWIWYKEVKALPQAGSLAIGKALTPQNKDLESGTRARYSTTTAFSMMTRPGVLSSKTLLRRLYVVKALPTLPRVR